MDGLLKIIESFSETNHDNISIYVKALNEHQSFQQTAASVSQQDAVVTHLTSLLNKPTTKHVGLLILQEYLKQCGLGIIERKGSLWATLTIKACSQKVYQNSFSLAFNVLEILIQKSIDIPELSKAFTSNHFGKIFESLPNQTPSSHLAALNCLYTILKLYPGPCGTGRNIIEKFILSFIDNPDEDLVVWSAKCLLLLQQVRGSGNQNLTQKTSSWQTLQNRLIGSLHDLFNSIYENCPEVYDDEDIGNEKLAIPDLILNDEPILRSLQLLQRFKNLIKYLIIAIKDPFPTVKSFLPKRILNLISRGLAINCIILQENLILDNIAIGAFLPEIHIQLFQLLDCLMLTLKSHLSMHFRIILNYISNCLKWTSSGKSKGSHKPYSNLRIATYKSLALWTNIMKYGSCVELIADTCIEEIIYDITPFERELTLQVLSGAKKHMSKKARRSLHKAQNQQTNIGQTHSKQFNPENTKIIYSDEGNQMLCAGALKCLKGIILSATIFLRSTTILGIQDKIVLLSLEIKNNSITKKDLYFNTLCRQNLYDCLFALISAPSYFCPPPTRIAMIIFGQSQINDPNLNCREICAEYLRNIEKIIHPQKECLNFIPDNREIENIRKEYQKIQKRKLDEIESEESEEDDEIIKNGLESENHVSSSISKQCLEIMEVDDDNESENEILQNEAVQNGIKDSFNKENGIITIESENKEDKEEATIVIEDEQSIHNIEESSDECEEIFESLIVEETTPEKKGNNIISEEESISNEPILKKPRLDKTITTQIIEIDDKIIEDEDDMVEMLASNFVDDLNKDSSD